MRDRPVALVVAAALAAAVGGLLAMQVGRPAAGSAERPHAERRRAALINVDSPAGESVGPAASTPETTGGWPNLYGPARNSISPETGLATEWGLEGPPELWRVSIGTGYSAPIVVGGRVIVFHRQGDEEIVECFAAESGESGWRHHSPTAYRCELPPYSSGPYSTPASDGRYVYALGAEGLLHCLRLDDGDVVWLRNLSDEYQVPEHLFAVGHSPLLLDGRLILNVGGTVSETGVLALDSSTGQTLWGATDHGASYSTPAAAVIHGQPYVFVLTDQGLVALDPRDGRVFWTIEFAADHREAPSAVMPLVHGDLVLATVYQVGTLCLRVLPDGRYKELWRQRRNLESQFNPLIGIDGYVYGWHFSDKSLRCIELETGQLQWRYKSAISRGTHIAVDGRLVLFGEHGELGSVDINPHKLVKVSLTAGPRLDSPCYSAPALSNGLLYLRNERSLACFSLRPGG